MAAPIVIWVCREFSRFDIDISEENARYILSMNDPHDLEEYMYELLDKKDARCKKFVNELLDRWKPSQAVPDEVQVYKKPEEEESYFSGVVKKPSPVKKVVMETDAQPPFPTVNGLMQLAGEMEDLNVDIQQSEKHSNSPKKKNKFVPLYSQEGKARSAIQIPGRHCCECQASKHRLISNCVSCGRVVCEQEGSGPCLFCGELVCTQEEQEILSRGSKKSEKLRQFLTKGDNRDYLPTTVAKMEAGFEKALQHKDRLLDYDRTSVSRTKVIDDESDYFASNSKWLSKSDRAALKKREAELRSKRHASRKDRKITLDFAGRRVIDVDDSSSLMYNEDDEVVQQVHYGARPKQALKESAAQGEIMNPTIEQLPPKFVPPGGSYSKKVKGERSEDNGNVDKRSSVRIQDRELQEMNDEGMCMSMHQPWASLLIKGIKKHEGRTWYTPHRGRLWIAATGKTPEKDDIEDVEQFYRQYYNDPKLKFPTQYPVSCLLGCVNVLDCLGQEEYRQKFPEGESASAYVFICDHPQELVIKFPIKGKHKIYKLENHIHQGAKKGLRSPETV
ncbi:activating signal cointegrator 1-like isoform X2 [Liolophura sinensis]|uniref:activating signal cointegrator 1-like isoform X2 n=1 Tax=Liolophura sinensis TaxID=3198878 RepID=UPI0031597E5E